jgi:hypothetical protein
VPEILTQAGIYRRIALHGPPKSGKSWIALSVPDKGIYQGKVIYVAADPGSEAAALSMGDRFIVVKPSKTKDPKTNKLRYDPLHECSLLASRDWATEFGARTLIWDTMTHSAREMMAGIADSGSFSDKHVTIGRPGTASFMAAPMPGDYGAAQIATYRLLDFLFEQPMNIITVWHGDIVEPEAKGTNVVIGGPTSVGKASVVAIAGRFDNLFRTEVHEKLDQQKRIREYRIYTEKRGVWLAGIRLKPGRVNPIPMTVVPAEAPGQFWQWFEEAIAS